MYVRVWEYEVIDDAVADFVVAYGADGDWARLFARGEGYVGTELYQNARAKTLFLTIDTWRNQSDWRAFLDEWRGQYEALDYRLGSLTTWERALVEANPIARSGGGPRPITLDSPASDKGEGPRSMSPRAFGLDGP